MTKDQIMALVDAFAEARHVNGAPVYNIVAKEARAAVVAALEGVSSVHTQEPVAWEIETENQQGGYDRWVTTDKKNLLDMCDRGAPVPLYAAPQPDLMHAAKLALDALRGYEASIKQFGLLFGNGTRAIEALKKAGVK